MRLRRFWALAATAAFVSTSMAPTLAAAKPTDAMMKPIRAALVAVNTMNPSSLSSGVYASNATVTDEFSHYTWSGPNAGVSWINDYIAWSKKMHFTGGKGTLRPVEFFDQTGDRAYIVVPTDFVGMMGGKSAKEFGTWTFTLVRSGNAWLILTESWGTVSMKM